VSTCSTRRGASSVLGTGIWSQGYDLRNMTSGIWPQGYDLYKPNRWQVKTQWIDDFNELLMDDLSERGGGCCGTNFASSKQPCSLESLYTAAFCMWQWTFMLPYRRDISYRSQRHSIPRAGLRSREWGKTNPNILTFTCDILFWCTDVNGETKPITKLVSLNYCILYRNMFHFLKDEICLIICVPYPWSSSIRN
jgi:hypothetical protein